MTSLGPIPLPSAKGLAELFDLVLPTRHPMDAAVERAKFILTRVRQISLFFAILSVLWIAVDAATLPQAIWTQLALARLGMAVAFLLIGASRRPGSRLLAAYLGIGYLILVCLAFILFADGVLDRGREEIANPSIISIYYFSPLLLAAGLAVFPLTLLESLCLALPIVVTMIGLTINWPDLLHDSSTFATMWRLLLIALVASCAGMNQLRLLLVLFEGASRDGLTGLLGRSVGEDVLTQQYAFARRHNRPFTLLFMDLDGFKTINDGYGHDAGDDALRTTASRLRRGLRAQDVVVRWGGDEFVIGLPDSDEESAVTTLRRIASLGLGYRPDGQPLTASIGISERKADGDIGLHALVELADKRMYAAKNAGRNRYKFQDEPIVWRG